MHTNNTRAIFFMDLVLCFKNAQCSGVVQPAPHASSGVRQAKKPASPKQPAGQSPERENRYF